MGTSVSPVHLAKTPYKPLRYFCVCTKAHEALQTKPEGLSGWCMVFDRGPGGLPWRCDSAAQEFSCSLVLLTWGALEGKGFPLHIQTWDIPRLLFYQWGFGAKIQEDGSKQTIQFCRWPFCLCAMMLHPHVILDLKGWVYSFQGQHLIIRCWRILNADIVQRELSKRVKQSSCLFSHAHSYVFNGRNICQLSSQTCQLWPRSHKNQRKSIY